MATPAPNDPVTYAEFSVVVDHMWTLLAAFLVFMMQAGFSILESGMVRMKNVKNIMIKNVLDASVGAFMWWGFGYAFAYGGGNYEGGPANGFIGSKDFFFIDAYQKCAENSTATVTDGSCLYGLSVNEFSYGGWIFQWAFAATAATITAGAVAERCTFVGYLVYTMALTGFIYPVVVHWVWSDYGWLSGSFDPSMGATGVNVAPGVADFAGSGVVHMVGGLASLVGAIALGPRHGRFDADGKLVEFKNHNSAFIGLGTLLLWFGWYGFNPGSTTALSGGNIFIAERVAVGTTLAAAGGGIGAMIMCLVASKYVDLAPVCNGILSGLVAVCSGVDTAEPWGCFLIGFFAAWVQYWVAIGIQRLRIDDPLDASAVHFGAGFFGLICGGLFGLPSNVDGDDCGAFFPGCGAKQLGVNLLGGLMIIVWVCGTAGIVFGSLRLAGVLRVPKEEEVAGLDKSLHGGPGVHMDSGRKFHEEPSGSDL